MQCGNSGVSATNRKAMCIKVCSAEICFELTTINIEGLHLREQTGGETVLRC